MRIGSLFSGIGGLELGLEWAGVGHTVWQVEREPFCRDVLAKHWPDVKRYDDVCTAGAHNLEPVDVICGGFPCQDISYAGKGAGLGGARSGLWYEFARIIGELGPGYVVVENVAALLRRGMGEVLGTLSDLGYDAEWDIVSARDVGAPHLRRRVFIVAYNRSLRASWGSQESVQGKPSFSWCEDVRGVKDLRGRPTIPPPIFRGTRDGIPDWMDRVKSCGNAVVPQVAEIVGRRLLDIAGKRD